LIRPLPLLALLALAPCAEKTLAAEGRLLFENETGTAVERSTLTGRWVAPPPQRLAARERGEARVAFPDRGVVVGQVSYRESGGRRGCGFRVQTEPGPVLCRVVVVTEPGGGASCHYRFDALDSATCGFAVTFTLSGF